MLKISNNVSIPDNEIEISAIRSQGAGGQNVNKVSSAIHLRFDISASSLPEFYKSRLLALQDARISKEGIIIIKAQRFRSQEKNRLDALERLAELVKSVAVTARRRIPTRPSKTSSKMRMDKKQERGKLKTLRTKVTSYE